MFGTGMPEDRFSVRRPRPWTRAASRRSRPIQKGDATSLPGLWRNFGFVDIRSDLPVTGCPAALRSLERKGHGQG